MTTAIQSRTLAEELAERWRATENRASDGTGDDAIEDAATVVQRAMVGDYYVTEDGNAPPLAHVWMDEVDATVAAVAKAAWEAHVVPKIVEALVAVIPTAPAYLAAFPDSKQLRADLALLAGGAA